MSESNPTYQPTPVSNIKMLRAMVGIGVVCALLIVLTFEGTLPRIERNKAEALEKALFKVLPGITKKRAFHFDQNDGFVLLNADEKQDQLIYAGYDQDDKLVGLALEASGMGFADVLRILYGYNPYDQEVVGFYVLESKETPGLGDKIEKDDDFLTNFDALDVSLTDNQGAIKNPVIPVKHGKKENPWEVDGITGATISSRAIANIIGTSTAKWVPLVFNNRDAFMVEKSNQ